MRRAAKVGLRDGFAHVLPGTAHTFQLLHRISLLSRKPHQPFHVGIKG